jgi:hypothetical protein
MRCVEKGSVDGDGMLHHGEIAVAILVEHGQDHASSFEYKLSASSHFYLSPRAMVAAIVITNRPSG